MGARDRSLAGRLFALTCLLGGCQGGDPGGSGGESDSFDSVPTINPATTSEGADPSEGSDTSGGPITTSGADCAVWEGGCIAADDEPRTCSTPSQCCTEYSHESCLAAPGEFPNNWDCMGGACVRDGGCLNDADCGATGFSCVEVLPASVRFCVLTCELDGDCAAQLPGTTCSGQALGSLFCAAVAADP